MLMKEISNVSGVLNLMSLRIYNEFNPENYSPDISIDPVIDPDEDGMRALIDTNYTKYTLNSDVDAMFEIKYPDTDIRVRSIVR